MRRFRNVGGVGIASTDSLHGLHGPGTGTGHVATPSDLRPTGRIVDAGPTGPVAERDVSSRLKVDRPVIEGGHADLESITREIRARRKAIAACYERALKQKPTLAGKLVIRFSITAAGTISAVDIDDGHPGRAGGWRLRPGAGAALAVRAARRSARRAQLPVRLPGGRLSRAPFRVHCRAMRSSIALLLGIVLAPVAAAERRRRRERRRQRRANDDDLDADAGRQDRRAGVDVRDRRDQYALSTPDKFWVDLYAATFDTCVAFGAPSDADNVTMMMPKTPGSYPLSLAQNATLYVASSSDNLVATKGLLVIDTVTATTISGGMHITYNADNTVDGQFQASICP